MVDNIILIEVALREAVERSLRVLKARDSGYDSRRHAVRISSRGMTVEPKG